MKNDIILAGVGGQGVLSIASVLAKAAAEAGLTVRQSEVHGMAQRGGAVLSHLRISGAAIACDLIPRGKVDVILSMELLESLRYMDFLAPDGAIVTASEPLVNIDNYPDPAAIVAEINHRGPPSRIIEASALAQQTGNRRAINMVMAGAASRFLRDIPLLIFENVIKTIFASRSPEANIEAFRLGRA
ncbi:MAG: indolepyruvate oxidoreductase subunit beta [Spirochaetaceae bacterium]|jgi:indolepyruvate ferredoxin oxidoreductase beta subunit|nr:indolepyruvate oxidoreductase subunit beta [Spirochaetaceae bacterium]